MAYTQDGRLIALDTPLGKDALLLQGFTGVEGISRLFRFQLDLLSEDAAIDPKKIVGQRVTISLTLADETPRFINGFVSRFAQAETGTRFTHYRADVVPWLWFLTRTSDCRIFQKMTVPDIIAKIFTDLGFTDFKLKLQGSFEPREYCVQYRETDFNFVSRLMEEYGIFYFFEHEEKKHALVLANSPGAVQPCPDQAQARCEFTGAGYGEEDLVTGWHMEQELRPGKYALNDYNFETPSTKLLATVDSTITVGGNTKYEIYDYPGEYLKKPQGQDLAKLRMEEEEAAYFVAQGNGTCRGFISGYRFELRDHYRRDVNTAWLLTEIRHEASAGSAYSTAEETSVEENYSNRFTCIPYTVPFRAPRVTPQPFIQGVQTAVVVGPGGEEIHTDKHGRVKVQFHWDREGKYNENSSCWIRVSQPWSGKNWGTVSIPRIGQEVIISFLEGDPDQPIITGRVYNAEQMPPYTLPGGGVVSGWKSKTHKGVGYNEMSMDDTKGKEKVTIHAQYDMGTTVEHDDTQTIHNDRTITVDGTHTETIKKATKITITEGTYNHDVAANTADYHVKKTLTILCDANILIQAADEIKLLTGQSVMVMKKNGEIKISGDKIEVTAGTTTKMGVGNQSVTCDLQKVATSGAAINSSAVGMHEITGAVVKIN